MGIKSQSAFLFITLLVLSTFAAISSVDAQLTNPGALVARGVILVNGSANFTAPNGVSSGDGSAGNPYIIENWDIDSSSDHGIYIQHTREHVIVRNCKVQGGYPWQNNILIINATNVTVENCDLDQGRRGVFVRDCADIILKNNTCTNGQIGIWLRDSEQINIDNNTIRTSQDSAGIYLERSNRSVVSDNNITQTQIGIFTRDAYFNDINNNTITANTQGIKLETSYLNDIKECNVTNCPDTGIYLDEGSNNTIDKCTLLNNDRGIYIYRSPWNKVERSTIKNGHYGVQMINVVNSTLTNCILNNLTTTGFVLDYSSGNEIQNCSVSEAAIGFEMDFADENIIRNSNINDTNSGISVISSLYNTISENSISNSIEEGIYLQSSYFCVIDNNSITESQKGLSSMLSNQNFPRDNTYINISSEAISLIYSSNNVLLRENIDRSYYGIFLSSDSDMNEFHDTKINNCSVAGFFIEDSFQNTIANSAFFNNYYGVDAVSDESTMIKDSIFTKNTFGLKFTDSWANDVKSSKFNNNSFEAVRFISCDHCDLLSNRVHDNTNGIIITESQNCDVADNVFNRNDFHGAILDSCTSCTVYYNCFANNNNGGVQAYDNNDNKWDHEELGNYWSDYKKRYPNSTSDEENMYWTHPYFVEGESRDKYPRRYCNKDLTPPTDLIKLCDDNATTGDPYTFSFSITDDVKVEDVWINITAPEWFTQTIRLEDGAINWPATIDVPSNATYIDYEVYALDAGNNAPSNSGSAYTITVHDNDNPIIEDLSPEFVGTGDDFELAFRITDNVADRKDPYTPSPSLSMGQVRINHWFYGNTPTQTVVVSDSGYYNVSLKAQSTSLDSFYYNVEAYDGVGNVNVTPTREITIYDNDKPLADAGEDQTIYLGQSAVLDGQDSYDPIGIKNYTWQFNIDGKMVELYGAYFVYAFNTLGAFHVILSVSDDAGNIAYDSITINVAEVPDTKGPTIEIISLPSEVYSDQDIHIKAKITDESQVVAAWISYTALNGTIVNRSITHQGLDDYAATIEKQNQIGTIAFRLSAMDDSGNIAILPAHKVEIISRPDTTPPTITKTTPGFGQDDMNISSDVIIEFSEPMDIGSVVGSIDMEPDVSRIYIWNTEDSILTIRFDIRLNYSTDYTINIGNGSTDKAGNPLSPTKLSFSTEDAPTPFIPPSDDDDDEPDPNYGTLILISFIIVLVIILIAFGMVLYRRRKESQKTNAVSHPENDEIEEEHEPVVVEEVVEEEEEEFEFVYSFYEILGVPRDASHKEIQRAYRNRSKECHPDRCSDEEEAEKQRKLQIELNKAKEALLDPQNRREYDVHIGYKTYEDLLADPEEEEDDWDIDEDFLDSDDGRVETDTEWVPIEESEPEQWKETPIETTEPVADDDFEEELRRDTEPKYEEKDEKRVTKAGKGVGKKPSKKKERASTKTKKKSKKKRSTRS